jgi:pimeloyl-ACP methyl ester carboxylesterase
MLCLLALSQFNEVRAMATLTAETTAGMDISHFVSAGAIQRTAFYLPCGEQPLFAWLHSLAGRRDRDHGVVIVPPIGFEQLHAHRGLRHLADKLARLGIPTLRFDWHGTGDSSGDDTEPERLATWLANARSAVNWMKDELGYAKVSVVGLRFGATLAALALDQVEFENLVLWAPVTNGRGSVREMHVIDMMSEGHIAGSEAAGTIEAAGFRLTAETAAALSKTSLMQSKPLCRRVLVANRDDSPADQRVIDHFAKLGLDVEQFAIPGVSQMLVEPHKGLVPEIAIQNIADWMDQHADSGEDCATSEPRIEELTSTLVQNQLSLSILCSPTVRETAICLSDSPNLFGILSEPTTRPAANLPTIILLNAGAAYRIGPGRMNVEMARQFASHGVRCLRLDLNGLGDSIATDASQENDSYAPTAFRDIGLTMQALRQRFGPQQFVLMGLCSGAYASFQASAQFDDPDLIEGILINPLTYFWQDGMSLETAPTKELIREHYYLSSALQPAKWLKLLSGRSHIGVGGALRMVAQRLGLIGSRRTSKMSNVTENTGPSHPTTQDLTGDLKRVAASRRQLSMFFSTTDPGYSILLGQARRQTKRMLRRQQLSVTFLDNADHTFSRHAARQRLIDSLCQHLQRRSVSCS